MVVVCRWLLFITLHYKKQHQNSCRFECCLLPPCLSLFGKNSNYVLRNIIISYFFATNPFFAINNLIITLLPICFGMLLDGGSPLLQVSISPTFYAQLFCTKVSREAFFVLYIELYLVKEYWRKCAHKMLVKLTPVSQKVCSANFYFRIKINERRTFSSLGVILQYYLCH